MERNSIRGRGRGRQSSSSSSSSSVSDSFNRRSHGHHSKPANYGRTSNPNHQDKKNWDERPTTVVNDEPKSKITDKQRCEEDDVASVSSLPSIVGTCPFMCPDQEREQRERLQDLSVFERSSGNPRKSSSTLAVKKFCRTISTKHVQASDLRPLPVLEDTLNYLLDLLNSREHTFEVVHDFIFDRTRSIRQDISMQNIIGDQVINMYEKMVKFHVISHYKLRRCNGNPNISSLHYLNLEQLTKALTYLYNLYDVNRNSHSHYENEAEFRSLYVLLHLDSDSQPKGESLSLWLRQVPSRIIKSKEMCFARKILRYVRLGNYKRFICTTAGEVSYLQFCIIEPHINEIRVLAVSSMNYGGYKLHPYPLAELSKLLMMKESDTESLCKDCGLETLTDEAGRKFLPAKQTSFHHPKGMFQIYCLWGSERLDSMFSDSSELLHS